MGVYSEPQSWYKDYFKLKTLEIQQMYKEPCHYTFFQAH